MNSIPLHLVVSTGDLIEPMKKAKGLIPLMYVDNRFEDLDSNPIFSIANSIDFIYFSEYLFILSKKSFEAGLNFRKGMIEKSEEFYSEVEAVELFVNLDILKQKAGDNQRYLRKIATIKESRILQESAILK